MFEKIENNEIGVPQQAGFTSLFTCRKKNSLISGT